ncbi:MAG: efflux RND transporter periplasmic adaptor subunit [Thermoguttaceae bacterium]|jgi:HlyD family secretion protein
MKTILAIAAVVAVAVVAGFGAAYYVSHRPAEAAANVAASRKAEMPQNPAKTAQTAKHHHRDWPGPIIVTGTVKPEEVVEVGAQVNGMIVSVGTDRNDPNKPLDQGSIVHKGEVLAQIDPTIYKAQVDYAEASLAKAKFDLQQLLARCTQSKQEWQRAQNLLPQKAIANTDYDLAAANCQAAADSVSGGHATVQQCEASLQVAKTYLSYTIITSPIDGVILDRRVNVGQIVCATFNVPGLFLVAKDLRRTQIWASVDEADIGQIYPGLPVQFTVDAYPGEVFEGKVSRIRLNPVTTPEHTTYTVIVATNPSRDMLPYLTAKLRFDIPRTKDAKGQGSRDLDIVAER